MFCPPTGPGIAGDVASAGGIDASFIDGAIENGVVVGEVGEQVHVGIKGENHGLVALAHDAAQESRPGILNGAEIILFAAGGVQKKAEGNRQIHLFGEEGDFFFVVVFENLEVVLLKVGDNAVVFVPHGCEEVDEVYFRLDDRSLALGLILSLSLASFRESRNRERDGRGPRQTPNCDNFHDGNLPVPDSHCFPVSLMVSWLSRAK
jgi:hypothetical protein